MAFACVLMLASCAARPADVANGGRGVQRPAPGKGIRVTDENLPINQRFRTLDDYLAWVKQYEAPTGRAWYKQVGPDRFELQTGNFHPLEGTPAAQGRVFTRKELERKFGFRK